MRKNKVNSFIILLFFAITGLSQAMAYAPVRRSELSNLCVRAIAQDSYGYIWIATANGLCKSYGNQYEVYFGEIDDTGTVPSNSVTNLYQDSDSCLLVATNLGVCGRQKGTQIFHRFSISGGNADFNAMGFVEYAGKIFAYGDDGLFVINKPDRTLECSVPVSGEQLTSAVEGPDGKLWLSNGSCIMAVDSSLKVTTRHNFAAADRVNTMSTDGKDLLLGTPTGMMKFDPKTHSITPTAIGSDVEVNAILAVDDTTRLIATGNRGVLVYDIRSGKTRHQYNNIDFRDLRTPEINNLYRDRRGNVWVATFDKGEVMLADQPKLFNINSKLSAFRNDFVTRAVYDSHGNLWAGTRSNGLAIQGKNSDRVHYLNSRTTKQLDTYSHDFVQSLYIDKQGLVWAGYSNSLAIYRPTYDADGSIKGLSVVKKFPFFLTAVTMAEDANGNKWIGTDDSGLYVIDRDFNVIKNIASPNFRSNNITKIIPYDSERMLAAAYNDNLYLIDINTLAVSTFDHSNQQVANNTIDMLIDSGGNLWIGTYHHGLFRIDGTTKELSRCLEGQRYYDIVAIAQDFNGDIWASSSYGIYRFDNKGNLSNVYLKSNGLGGNQFHEKCVATRPDGGILFGGNTGLDEVTPRSGSSLLPPTIPLAIKALLNIPGYTSALKGDQADIDVTSIDRLKLSHKDNSINIEFVAIDYDRSTGIEYSYMLRGHDKDFIYADTHPSVSYSDLSAGNYEFYAKARYKGKEWQQPVKLLSLSVAPNPWLSKTAYAIYILLLLSIIFGINRAYLRYRLIKQKYSLSEERILQEKTNSDNRIRFFTNISHELRTPLTLICGPAQHLRANYKSMTDTQISESFDFINSNIERLLTLINQLLSFRRLNSDTLPLQVARTDMAAQLESLSKLYTVYASENNVEIHLECDSRALLTYDSDKIEKIVSNLIVNAIKYSNDNGSVTIRLETLKNPEGFEHDSDKDYTYASISVCDNGRGMTEEDIPLIFQPFKRLLGINGEKKTEGFGIGLSYVANLVKVHKGIIRTTKNPGGGMTFTVIVPACDSAYSSEEFRGLFAPVTDDIIIENSIPVELPAPISDVDENDIEEIVEVEDAGTEETKSKILVVEDNTSLNTFIAGLFRDRYTVIQAANGDEGIEKAIEECPDIIISDILMPGEVDGYELCRQIKSDPSSSHISVVLLTAKTLDEHKAKGYTCGADAYLCKPFSPEVLIACVDNLNSKRLQQATLILASAGHSDATDNQTPLATDMSPLDKKFLEKLYAYIENNLDNSELNVNMLGRELGFSRTNFYRKVKALTGISPTDLLRVYRLNRAAELLLTREYTVGEVGEKIGFGSQSHFSSLFKKHFGVSPRTYVTNHFSQYVAPE